MKFYKLNNYTKGWFIGNFTPTLIDTTNFEVAIKSYKKGETEDAHYHKVADEITVVVSGKCSINKNLVFEAGDIIWIESEEVARFEALEDTTNVVIKTPSVKGDKYVVENQTQMKIPNGEPVSQTPTPVIQPQEVSPTPREGQ